MNEVMSVDKSSNLAQVMVNCGLTNFSPSFEFIEQLKFLYNEINSNKTEKFVDNDFPSLDSSIFPSEDELIFIEKPFKDEIFALKDNFKFVNIDSIFSKNQLNIFDKNKKDLFPLEVQKEKLGNNYFISALVSILNTKPQIFSELFENFQYNQQGIYGIKILVQGEVKLIIIDDTFPVYSRNIKRLAIPWLKNELWLSFITKAWTKATGKNYISKFFGTSYDAFNSLSFAPTIFFLHRKYDYRGRLDVLWSQLYEAIQKKYPICTTTEDLSENNDSFVEKDNEKSIGTDNYNSNSNLNIGYQNSNDTNYFRSETNRSFSVLEIFEYEETKLIKIWSPNEEDVFNWNGIFCNDSEEWNEELIEFVNFKKDKRIIYVTYEEYVKYFTWTFINKIENNYLYRSLKSHTYSGDSKIKKKEPQEKEDEYEESFDPESKRKFIEKNNQIIHEQPNNIINDSIFKSEFKNAQENKNDSIPHKPNESNINDINSNIFSNSQNINHEEISLISSRKKEIFDERDWILQENIFCSYFEVRDSRSISSITLHQPPLKKIESENLLEINAPLAFILIAKYENEKYTFISSEMVNWEKLSIEQNFESGVYHVFAKSYWKYKGEYNLVVSTYSDNINDILNLPLDDIPSDWLTQIISDMARRNDIKEFPFKDEPSTFASQMMFENNNFSGFCSFYYENSSYDGEMCINLSFKNMKGLKIFNLNQILCLPGSQLVENQEKEEDGILEYTSSLSIRVPTSSSIVVILQVLDSPWNCNIDWFHDIWFEYSVEIMINRMKKGDNYVMLEMDPEGLKLYEMEHDRGVIIVFENFASFPFKINFDIIVLKNLFLKSDDKINKKGEKLLEFTTKAKGITILNFAIKESTLDNPYKLRYLSKVEKILS